MSDDVEVEVGAPAAELGRAVEFVRSDRIVYLTQGGRRTAAIVPLWIAEGAQAVLSRPTHRALWEPTMNGEHAIFVYELITDSETGDAVLGETVIQDRPTADFDLNGYARRRLPELGYRVVGGGGAIFDLVPA